MVQPHIVLTTAEAEYIALSSASHEVIAVMNCQGFVLTVTVKQKFQEMVVFDLFDPTTM